MKNRYLVCHSCDAMNPSFEATCDECGAQLSGVSIDDSSRATQSVIGRRQSQPPSTLRLIGLWMISLPNIIAEPFFLFMVVRHMGGLAGYIMFWGSLGLTFLWFIILYRVTRNYFFRDQTPE